MKGPPRVVLDTNVVLSALLCAKGRLTPLRFAWQHAACHPLAGKATIDELMRMLTYPKFKLSTEDQHELLADYLPHCTTVLIPAKPPKTPPCRDAFDVPFLQLAIVGKADYLVTGDQDLLTLHGAIRCPIISADEFLTLITST